MQDTKLRNFQTLDTNKLKMHMKNKKRHKTRESKDQIREIIKNNLKIMKNTMHEFSKILRKVKKMQLTPTYNLPLESNRKHKIIFGFMILLIFLDFSKINWKKKIKDFKISNENSRNHAMLV